MDRIEDSVMYLRQSIQLRDEAIRLKPSEFGITILLESRRAFGRLLYRLGDRQQARLLFADNARLLAGLPTDWAGLNTPFQRLLAHVDSELFFKDSPPAPAFGNDCAGRAIADHCRGWSPRQTLRSPHRSGQS